MPALTTDQETALRRAAGDDLPSGAVAGAGYDAQGRLVDENGVVLDLAAAQALANASVDPDRKSALQALSLASTRRVDVVMIGDSNQIFGSYGFSAGLEKALGSRFGVYATPIIHWNSPIQHSAQSLAATNATTTSTDQIALTWQGSLGVRPRYSFVASGVSQTTNTGGSFIPDGTAFDLDDDLRMWFAYGVDDGYSAGTFNPGVRRNGSPFTSLGTIGATSTTGDFDGMRMVKMDLAAAARPFGLEQRWQIPNDPLTGPWVGYYTRAERPNKANGVSCSVLYGLGGQSAWNMAWSLQNAPDSLLTMFYAEIRRLQIAAGHSPIVVNYINTAINDRAETNTPSLGPARVFGTGDSVAEYIDNLRGIQNRIRRIWDINNWPSAELYWLFVPSHRISDPDDAEMVAYRAAAASQLGVEPQTSVVDLGSLMTYAGATAAGWYAAGESQLHLTTAGYDGVATLIAAQVP